MATELRVLVDFLNREYPDDNPNPVDLDTVRRLARPRAAGADIVEPGPGAAPAWGTTILFGLVRHAITGARAATT